MNFLTKFYCQCKRIIFGATTKFQTKFYRNQYFTLKALHCLLARRAQLWIKSLVGVFQTLEEKHGYVTISPDFLGKCVLGLIHSAKLFTDICLQMVGSAVGES